MKQPRNFASVLEGSLHDGRFVLDLMSSHQSSQYEFEPRLLAKVIASLTLDDRAHSLLHARLRQILRQEDVCGKVLKVLPEYLPSDNDIPCDGDMVSLLMEVFDNIYIYTLVVQTLYLDGIKQGKQSLLALSCHFGGLERKTSQLVVCEAIYTPFNYEMSWMYREASVLLFEQVYELGGCKCFVERAAVELSEENFALFCRHIVNAERRLQVMMAFMIVKNMSDTGDIVKHALSMKAVDQNSPIQYEFLVAALTSDMLDDSQRQTIRKRNPSLL